MHHFLRRLIISLGILFLFAIFGLGYYAYTEGFTPKWRNYIKREFRNLDWGMELEFSKLILHPLRGLVAEDVEIYRVGDGGRRPLAAVSRIILDIDYNAITRRGSDFLKGIDLLEASVYLPIEPDNPQSARIALENISASLYLQPDQIEIASARLELFGIELDIHGQLLNPKEWKHIASTRDPNKPRWNTLLLTQLARWRDKLEKSVDTLEQFRYANTPPELKIDFHGDLLKLPDLRANLHFQGQDIRYENYRIEQLQFHLHLHRDAISLDTLKWIDHAGTLSLRGEYRLASRQLRAALQSDIDFSPLIRSFYPHPVLKQFSYDQPPQIGAKLQWAQGESPLLVGNINLDRFQARGVEFESLVFDFSSNLKKHYFRNLTLEHDSGYASGHALIDNLDIVFQGESDLDPTIFLPFATPKVTRQLERWTFSQPPNIKGHGRGVIRQPEKWEMTGKALLGESAYRGVPFTAALSDFSLRERLLFFTDFRVDRKEGSAVGKRASFHLDTKITTLEDVRGTLFPVDIGYAIHPNLGLHLERYQCQEPPYLIANGIVDPIERAATDLRIEIDASDGFEYNFLGKDLPLKQIKGTLHFLANDLDDLRLTGTLFEGQAQGTATVKNLTLTNDYFAQILLERVDFDKLTSLYFKSSDSQGEISGKFDFQGQNDNLPALSGNGSAFVDNGDVFTIPIFGSLSETLSKVLPGAGYTVGKKASMDFTVAEGKITTDNLRITADLSKINGNGYIDIIDGTINLNMRLNMRGIPGIVLFPVSKLFEYICEGTLGNPIWRPKRLSRSKLEDEQQ